MAEASFGFHRGHFHFLNVPHINNRPLKTVLSYAKLKLNRRVASRAMAEASFDFQMAGRQLDSPNRGSYM
jgi:hypothetical protein